MSSCCWCNNSNNIILPIINRNNRNAVIIMNKSISCYINNICSDIINDIRYKSDINTHGGNLFSRAFRKPGSYSTGVNKVCVFLGVWK